VIDAAIAGAASLALGGVGAGQRLKLKRDVLHHMPEPGALVETLDKAAGRALRAVVIIQRWDQREQLIGEARQLVGRIVFQLLQIDGHVDGGLVEPVVRATVDPCFADFHQTSNCSRPRG
jgi:hypothetical protein